MKISPSDLNWANSDFISVISCCMDDSWAFCCAITAFCCSMIDISVFESTALCVDEALAEKEKITGIIAER